MSYFSSDFADFFSMETDRGFFLENWLKKKGISFSPIVLDQARHLYINFPSAVYNPQFKIKTLLVHYDRAPDSPGANDNGAAVFQVVSLVERLQKTPLAHNMRIFFTDGEEVGALDGVEEQGAFSIASRFKKLGIINDDVFVFDCCGRGDVLVLSTAGKNKGRLNFRSRFDELFSRTASLAKSVSPEKWITIPVPYGDNAGFIASGIPAVAITVLPKEEATDYMRKLQRNKKLEAAVMGHLPVSPEDLPLTWRLLHTTQDVEHSLTQDAFTLMERFLDALARSKTVI